MIIKTNKLKEILGNATLSTAKEKDSILHNTLIEIKSGKVRATSINNTTTLTEEIEIDTKEEGTFIVDPQKLLNIIKEINSEELEMKISEKTITIKSGNFRTTIKIQNNQTFPKPKSKEYKPLAKLRSETIKKLIKETIYCPDKNDISREYTGIYMEFNQDKIKATATDHYRLINVSSKTEANTEDNFIIENAGATLINRIQLNEEVELYRSIDELMIKSGNTTVTSKLISGSFPDYNQILLNKEISNTIKSKRTELRDAIKRSSILSPNREITLEINIETKKAAIKAENQEGETAEDTIEIIPIQAESNLIMKLDSKFILDFLNQTEAENIEIIYKTSEDPIMFEAEEENYFYKYIMTPIIE